MADVTEVFNTLADSATGAGEAAIARTEGEAAAGQAGSIGFSFKDSGGNVVLPQLNADGTLGVSFDSGTCLSARGENAGSVSAVDIATITLALSKLYSNTSIMVSCLRSSLFQIVYIDDAGGTPVETIIAEAIVGSGQYTVCCVLPCGVVDTNGGTGDQELVIRGTNFQQTSTMRASIQTLEAP